MARPPITETDLLRWAEALAGIARTGLGFTESLYERERFEEVLAVLAYHEPFEAGRLVAFGVMWLTSRDRGTARVLVTGSRDWDRPDVLAYALGYALGELGPFILVHGAARGADTMAATLHEQYGFTSEPHPANWESLGKRAGFVRNAEMVDLGADLCLAFWDGKSRGTKHTIGLARKAGIPTRVYTPGGLHATEDGQAL